MSWAVTATTQISRAPFTLVQIDRVHVAAEAGGQRGAGVVHPRSVDGSIHVGGVVEQDDGVGGSADFCKNSPLVGSIYP